MLEGENSVVRAIVNGNMDGIRPKHIYAAAAECDLLSLEAFQKIAQYIGIGVANIINIFNPQLVLIGGGIVKGRRFIEDRMLEIIKERTLTSCYSATRIEFSSEGRQDALKVIVDVVMEGLFLR